MNTEIVMMRKFHELTEKELQHVIGGEEKMVFLPDGKVIKDEDDLP